MWLEIFRRYISILLLGFIIKELDNEKDDDRITDQLMSRLLRSLKPYYLPYGLIVLAISMMLDVNHAFTLFSAAYMFGMFQLPHQRLPLKLKSYHEVLIILVLNLLLAPISVFLHSFIAIAIIQLIDDLMDREYDFMYGYFNYVVKFGNIEVILVIGILLISAFMLSWVDTLIVLPTAFLINYLYSI